MIRLIITEDNQNVTVQIRSDSGSVPLAKILEVLAAARQGFLDVTIPAEPLAATAGNGRPRPHQKETTP